MALPNSLRDSRTGATIHSGSGNLACGLRTSLVSNTGSSESWNVRIASSNRQTALTLEYRSGWKHRSRSGAQTLIPPLARDTSRATRPGWPVGNCAASLVKKSTALASEKGMLTEIFRVGLLPSPAIATRPIRGPSSGNCKRPTCPGSLKLRRSTPRVSGSSSCFVPSWRLSALIRSITIISSSSRGSRRR